MPLCIKSSYGAGLVFRLILSLAATTVRPRSDHEGSWGETPTGTPTGIVRLVKCILDTRMENGWAQQGRNLHLSNSTLLGKDC
jgi:hypothetical protein